MSINDQLLKVLNKDNIDGILLGTEGALLLKDTLKGTVTKLNIKDLGINIAGLNRPVNGKRPIRLPTTDEAKAYATTGLSSNILGHVIESHEEFINAEMQRAIAEDKKAKETQLIKEAQEAKFKASAREKYSQVTEAEDKHRNKPKVVFSELLPHQPINPYMNEFITDYLGNKYPGTDAVSASAVSKAWNEYAANKHIPSRDNVSTNLVRNAHKLINIALKDKAAAAGLYEVRTAHKLASSGLEHEFEQGVLRADDKTYLFTDKGLTDSGVADVASRLNKTFPHDKTTQVMVVTPGGVKHAFVHDKDTTVRGTSYVNKDFSRIKAARAHLDSLDASYFDESLQAKELKHFMSQMALKTRAEEQYKTLAKIAAGSHTGSLDDFKNLTTMDIKQLGQYARSDYKELQAFQGFDGLKVSDVLSKEDYSRLQFMNKNAQQKRSSTIYFNKYNEVVKIAKSLGIDKGAIDYDLGGLDAKGNYRHLVSDGGLDALDNMHAHLSNSKPRKVKDRSSTILRKFISSKPYEAMNWVLDNASNQAFISKYHLMDPSAANPLLNLEGYVKRGLSGVLGDLIADDTRVGKVRKMDPRLLEFLGNTLSKGSLEDFKQNLKLSQRWHIKKILKDDSLTSSGKLHSIESLEKGIKDFFGGKFGVDYLEQQISGPKEKNLRIATTAFASGSSYADAESSGDAQQRYLELREQQTAAMLERSKDPSYKNDILDMSLDDLKSLAEQQSGENTGVSIKSFGKETLLEQANRFLQKVSLGFDAYDFKEMRLLASSLGMEDTSNVKKTVAFIENYAKMAERENPNRIDTSRNIIGTRVGAGLASDIFTQSKDSYSKGFGIYDPGLVLDGPDGLQNWKNLVDARHGDTLNDMMLLHGSDASTIRPAILDIIEPIKQKIPEFSKIKELYSKHPHAATNFDQNVLEALRGSTTFNPETGRQVLTGSINAHINDVLYPITQQFGLKDFNATPGLTYFGKYQFGAKKKLANKGYTTSYNKRAAVKYLADNNLNKEFQATGRGLLGQQGFIGQNSNMMFTIRRAKLKKDLKEFIDYQHYYNSTDGVLRVDSTKALESTMLAIDMAFDNIEKHIGSEDYRSALAGLHGLETFDKRLLNGQKNAGTKTAKQLFGLMEAHPERTFDRLTQASTYKYIYDKSLAEANLRGFKPFNVGDEVGLMSGYANSLYAANEAAKQTGLGEVLTDSEIADKLRAYADAKHLTSRQDPMDVAKRFTRPSKSKKKWGTERFHGPILPPRKGFRPKSKPINQNLTYATKWDHNYPGFKKPVSFKQTGDNLKFRTIYDFDSPVPLRRRLFEEPTAEEIARSLLHYNKNITMLNSGGKIPGKGTKDEVPALLTKGEVVIDRQTSETLGIQSNHDYKRFQKAARAGKLSHFADGGSTIDARTFRDLASRANGLINIAINNNAELEPKRFDDLTNILKQLNDSTKTLTETQTAQVAQINKTFGQQNITAKSIPIESIIPEQKAKPRPKVQEAKQESTEKQSTKKTNIYQVGGPSNIEVNAKNLIADINSGNLNVKDFNKLDSNIVNEMLNFEGNPDKNAVDIAKRKVKRMNFGKALGITAEESNLLYEVGHSTTSKNLEDISEDLKAKLKAIDPDTLDSALSLYGNTDQKNAIRGVLAGEGTGKGPAITRAQMLSSEAEVLKEVLGVNFEGVKTNQDIKDRLGTVDLDKVKVKGGYSTNRLRQQSDALGLLASTLSGDDFRGDGRPNSGYGRESASVRGIRDQIGSSERLRTGSASRYREFAALTMQNAAFGASYAIIGGAQQLIGSTVGFVAQFDDSMKNLQAITGETSDGLDTMSNAVKRVSVQTKFSALEIAEAGTILGQAGFSATDIDKSLSGVVQLATATGSGLEESTQVLTSALTIWDNSIADSTKYANQFTAAVNESKLDINALALTLQYAGNIAAEADIPVEDVTTMTSLLKDAGIKRGSTLGTGQRLLYSDIANPSKKFAKSLETVGISLASFNEAFNDQGLYGALKLMKESGYGLAQATKGMELREKSIYTAAINQLDQFQSFRDNITNTDASYIANKTQMEGLGNSFKNMINSWQINLNESFSDYKSTLGKVLSGLTIDIPKKDPANTLTTKGVTVQDRDAKEGANFSIIQGLAGAGALAYLGKDKLAEMSFGSLGKTSLGKFIKEVGVGKVAGIAGGVAGVGLSAYQRAQQPEGSRASDFVNDMTGIAAIAAGSRMTAGMANGAKKYGKMMGIGIGIALLDNAAIKPLRESDSPISRMLGNAATGAGIGGAFLGKKGALLGGIAGGIYGLTPWAKSEADKKDSVGTVGAIANDLKALTSEMSTLNKGASSISSLSNFAMRPSSDASYLEKMSKFRLTAQTMGQMSDNLKILEASLSSHATNGFSGFDFGSALRKTPTTSTRKGPDGKAIANEASVEDNSFFTKVFKADGVNITSETVTFNGDAVDAAAMSYRSGLEASYKAFNAKGGGGDSLIDKIDSSDLGQFIDKLDEQKNVKDVKAVSQAEGIKPILDIIQSRPGFSVRNSEALFKQIEAVNHATRIAIAAKSSNDIARTKNLTQFSQETARRDSQIREQLSMAGGRATTMGAIRDITEAHMDKFLAKAEDFFGQSKFKNTKEAKAAFDTTTEGKSDREAYVRILKDTSGANSLFTKLAAGKNKLDALNTVGVDLARNLSKKVSVAVAGALIDAGPAMTQGALNIASSMAANTKEISSSLKKQSSKLGDLTDKSTVDVVKNGKEILVSGDAKEQYKKYLNFKPTGDKESRKKQLLTEEKKLGIKTEGLVTLGNVNALTDGMKALTSATVKSYQTNKASSDRLAETIFDITSLSDPRAQADIGIYKAVEALDRNVRKAGFKDLQAFHDITPSSIAQGAQLTDAGVEAMQSFFSDKVLTKLKNTKDRQLRGVDLHHKQAVELIDFQKDVSIREANIQSYQAGRKLQRNFDFQVSRLAVNLGRVNRDIEIGQQQAKAKAAIGAERQIQALDIRRDRSMAKLKLDFDYATQDLALQEIRAKSDIATKESRGRRDLDIRSERAFAKLRTDGVRALDDLRINKGYQEEDLSTKVARAYRDLSIKESQGRRDIGIAARRGREDIQINENRQRQAALLNYSRGVRDLNLKAIYGRQDLATQAARGQTALALKGTRGKEDLGISYSRNIEDLQIQNTRRQDKLVLENIRQLSDLDLANTRNIAKLQLNTSRQFKDLELSAKRREQDLIKGNDRAIADLDVSKGRQRQDLNTRIDRSREDLTTKRVRGIADLTIKETRSIEDIVKKTVRAEYDLQTAGTRKYEDLATTSARQRQALSLKGSRGREDITTAGVRGAQDIELSYSRSLDNIALSGERSLRNLTTGLARNLEDITTKTGRQRSDAVKSRNRGSYDIGLNYNRNLQNAFTKLTDSLAAMSRNYNNNIAALDRSKSDTIDAFNRNLDKPQTVSITPESLSVIASNLGDVTLALDAHKAALTNNTTAVKQNTAIQKTSEDLAKEAYKDAYKKVGGEVYGQDGTVNQDFLDQYNQYMDKNSDKLVDTILGSALDSAFAGGSFDINKALQSGEYLANAVARPDLGVTTDVAASAYTADELTSALYGIKAGEVRVSSTAGIIIDAQGGMEGALFDLESAMIQIGIKLRELNISYANSLNEAAINYNNVLRDLAEANSRSLEDLQMQFGRQLEDIAINSARQAIDAELAFRRALEDLALQLQYKEADAALARAQSYEDLATKLSRAGEDLVVSMSRATEDLNISLRQAGEDIALSLDRASKDLELAVSRWNEDLAISLARAAEDLGLSLLRAGEDLNTSVARSIEDLDLGFIRASEDLALRLSRAGEDLDISLARAGEDLAISITRANEDLAISLAQAGEDLAIQMVRANEDLAISITQANEDIARGMARAGEDLALKLSRAGEDLNISMSYAAQDLTTNIARAGAALATSLRDAMVDISIGTAQASDDLARNISRAGEDLATSMQDAREALRQQQLDAQEDIDTRFNRGVDGLAIKLADAGADLKTQLHDASVDLTTNIRDAKADLKTNIIQAGEDLATNFERGTAAVNLAYKDGMADTALALKQQLQDIAIQTADARAKAKQDYLDALEDIKARYAFDKNELKINTDENRASIERGIADMFKKLKLTDAQAVENIENQFKEQTKALYDALVDWSKQTKEDIKAGLQTKQWNLANSFDGLETNIKEALAKLKIDGDVIFKQVAAGFRQAVSGDNLKQLVNLTSEAAGDILKGAFNNLSTPVEETIKDFGDLLGGLYDKEMSKKVNGMLGLMDKDAKTTKTSLRGFSDTMKSVGSIITDVAEWLSGTIDNLSRSTKDALAATTGLGSLAQAVNLIPDMSGSISNLAASVSNLGVVPSTMNTAASSLNTASSNLSSAAGGVQATANNAVGQMAGATSTMAGSYTDLAGVVVGGAANAVGYINGAINSLNQALANAPTRSSVGGRVGTGYGGGDSEHYLLEPGEYVVRKEIVRQFGDSYFDDLNNGITRQSVRMVSAASGLPSQSGGSINVNIGISADTGLSTIENNMDQIADGVKRIFEEYS